MIIIKIGNFIIIKIIIFLLKSGIFHNYSNAYKYSLFKKNSFKYSICLLKIHIMKLAKNSLIVIFTNFDFKT